MNKRFGAAQLESGQLGELVDLISTIGFAEGNRQGDVLGEVYEYFLGQLASAEGKKGGQFYTPAHVVKTGRMPADSPCGNTARNWAAPGRITLNWLPTG